MNIEGAEQLAIKGMSWLIERTQHVAIACHDFIADMPDFDETATLISSDRMRTKQVVREFLIEHGFRVTSNTSAAEPWTRDYLYGHRDG